MTASISAAVSASAAPADASPGSAGRWWLAFVAAAAVFLATQWQLLTGAALPAGDGLWFFAPQHVHLAECIRAGRLALWDPWSNAGLPTCAYPEVGTFSPLTLLAAWLTGPTPSSFVVYWAAVWLLGGLGMLLLARHLGAPPWGGFVVTLGFLFSGYFAEHAQHVSWMFTFAAIPWVIWRLDQAWLSRRVLPAVQSGALWGLSLMAGYPGVLMASGMLAGLWLVGRALCSPTGRTTALLRCVVLLTLWGVVGLLVMCPTLLTFLKETPGYTERSDSLPRGQALEFNYLHARGFCSLATPYSPIWQGVALQWSGFDASRITSLYLGFVASGLALAAMLFRPRQLWRWWLVAIAAVGLALAVGPTLPFRGWLYDYCPPSRFFKHSVIFQLLAIFVSFVLAALATSDLRRAQQPGQAAPRRRLALAALVVGVAGCLGCWYARATPDQTPLIPWEYLLPSLVGWAVVIVLGLIGLGVAWRPWLRKALLGAVCLLAIFDAWKTSTLVTLLVHIPDPGLAADWQRLVRAREPSLDLTAHDGLNRKFEVPAPIPSFVNLRNLSSKTPVLNVGGILGVEYHQAWVATPCLREAAIGPRRMWFAPTAVELPWNSGTFHGFFLRAIALGAPPMVVHSREALIHPPKYNDGEISQFNERTMAAPAAQPIDVALDAYHANRLDFRVECPRDGWLLVTDRWAPGWTATVNGQPATIYGGMFLFRALKVRAGPNAIQFRYRPWGHPWLLAISYATLGLVLAASWRGRGRRATVAAP